MVGILRVEGEEKQSLISVARTWHRPQLLGSGDVACLTDKRV